MKRWECSVCGYIHEGEEPPEKCPICGAAKEKFFEIGPAEAGSQAEDAPPAFQGESATSLFDTAVDLIVKNHFHPIAVHFPNGVVPIAVACLVLAMLFSAPALTIVTYVNLLAVLLTMPVVLVTGYATWQKKYDGEMTSLFKKKIGASCSATVILFGLVAWCTVNPEVLVTASLDRWLFLLWSLIVLALVGLAGHLGGQLVFAKKKNSLR